jgi:hypothetical protein
VSLDVRNGGTEEVRLKDIPRLLLVEHFNQKPIFLHCVGFQIFSAMLCRSFQMKNEFTFHLLFCRSSRLSLMNRDGGLLNIIF